MRTPTTKTTSLLVLAGITVLVLLFLSISTSTRNADKTSPHHQQPQSLSHMDRELVHSLQHKNPHDLLQQRNQEMASQEEQDKRGMTLFVLPKLPGNKISSTVAENDKLSDQWQQILGAEHAFQGVIVKTVSKNKIAVHIPPPLRDQADQIREALKAMDSVDYTEWAPTYSTLS